MFAVREPSPARLDALLDDQSGRSFSYPHVGATADALPKGYRRVRQTVDLGYGTAVFDRAAEGLRRWQAHRRSGVVVHPPDAGVEEGRTVILAVPVAFGWVTSACRVVYVTEGPSRLTFAYGTLPRHVVSGEEAFAVERDDVGRVRFTITAFVRPRPFVLRPVGPLVSAVDQRLVRRYLQGLRDYVARHP